MLLMASHLRLVDDLGLRSTLTEYKVPHEDVLEIAQLAAGKEYSSLPKVVALLESLYA